MDNLRPLIPKDVDFHREQFLDFFNNGIQKLLHLKFDQFKVLKSRHDTGFLGPWLKDLLQTQGVLLELKAQNASLGYLYLDWPLTNELIDRALGAKIPSPRFREELSLLDEKALRSYSSLLSLAFREGIRPFQGNIDIEISQIKDLKLMAQSAPQKKAVFHFHLETKCTFEGQLYFCLLVERFR